METSHKHRQYLWGRLVHAVPAGFWLPSSVNTGAFSARDRKRKRVIVNSHAAIHRKHSFSKTNVCVISWYKKKICRGTHSNTVSENDKQQEAPLERGSRSNELTGTTGHLFSERCGRKLFELKIYASLCYLLFKVETDNFSAPSFISKCCWYWPPLSKNKTGSLSVFCPQLRKTQDVPHLFPNFYKKKNSAPVEK